MGEGNYVRFIVRRPFSPDVRNWSPLPFSYWEHKFGAKSSFTLKFYQISFFKMKTYQGDPTSCVFEHPTQNAHLYSLMAKHVTVIMKIIINLNLVELVFFMQILLSPWDMLVLTQLDAGVWRPPLPLSWILLIPLCQNQNSPRPRCYNRKRTQKLCAKHIKLIPKKELLSVKTHIQEANFFRGKVDPCGKSKWIDIEGASTSL